MKLISPAHYLQHLTARTRHNEYDYEGIRILDLPKWLSETT